MDSEQSQTDENDIEPKSKSNEEINTCPSDKQSTLTQTCDYHPLSFMAMDYYKKYGENRDFPQYFILHTNDNDANIMNSQHSPNNQSMKSAPLQENDPLQNQEKNCTRPPLIGQDNINSETNEDVLEYNQPTSPSSSIASNKRLEWDSGADVGYSNYFNNKCRDRSNSLPQLSMIERLALGKRMLRLEPEGVTNETQQHTLLIAEPASQKQDENANESKNSSKAPNKLKNMKLNFGIPTAESTPLLQNIVSAKEKECEITPILNNPSKNKNSECTDRDKCDQKSLKYIEHSSSESETSYKNNKNPSNKLTDLSEKSNEGCEHSLNLSKKSSNSCEDISLSPSISVDKIRRYRSYSNLDYEIIASKTSRHSDGAKKLKKRYSEKQIQTISNSKLMVSKSIQVSDTFLENNARKTNVKSKNVTSEENYKIHSSSEDPLEGSSKMYQLLSDRQVIGTLNLPKSNSFEYLPGDTYEKRTSSDLHTESESLSPTSKNRKKSYKSTQQLSDTSILQSDEMQKEPRKMKYLLNKSKNNIQLQPSSSNFSQTSSGIISSGNNSLNSTFERIEKSKFSNSLVVDLKKTIDLLKKCVDSKKCSVSDKKKLIKIVVKKLVEANYEEDTDFDEQQINKNRQSTTYLRTSDAMKVKNGEKKSEEKKSLQDIRHNEKKDDFDNSENTEDDILLHIYDRLGIEEDENGIIRKKKKVAPPISKMNQVGKREGGGDSKKNIKNEKFSSKSHVYNYNQETDRVDSHDCIPFKGKVKTNICPNSQVDSKKYKSKENPQKITRSFHCQCENQTKEFIEKIKQCDNCSRKMHVESIDSRNICKACIQGKSIGESENSKRKTLLNHVDKTSTAKPFYREQSTCTTSNFESNSYDSTYNTSSSRTNWRENKTASEKLLEETPKCKYDYYVSGDQLLKRKSNKHPKMRFHGRYFTGENEKIKQTTATESSNDKDRNRSQLSKFVNAERGIQISWIDTEIKHLNNLKLLLGKQELSNTVDKSVVCMENENKDISAPDKTMSNGSNLVLEEKRYIPRESNGLSKLKGIDGNSNNQYDLEWSSHKNMKISDGKQTNSRNQCQNREIDYMNDNNIDYRKKATSHMQSTKSIKDTLNKNPSQDTNYFQTMENMHLNTVINKDLVFASGDAKPRTIDEKDLLKSYSSDSKKSGTYTSSQHSKLHNRGVYTTLTANTQFDTQSSLLNENLTGQNETDSICNKIEEVDVNRIDDEPVCSLKDQKSSESISSLSKKQNTEMKTTKLSQTSNEKYQVPLISNQEKEYRESFTQTPSITSSRHSSCSGKQLKSISDVDKHKRIDAFTQTVNHKSSKRNSPEQIVKKSHSESTDINSDVFTCSNRSEKSNQHIQEINDNYNPSPVDFQSNASVATLSNSIKCEFCTRIATRKKVIESIKNCKCCQDSENVRSESSKSYELCSRCDKIIQSKVMQDQRCLSCFHTISKKNSLKQTIDTHSSSKFSKNVKSIQSQEPVAYFLKVESKEDLRNSDDELLQHRNVSLEEVKVFVPKRKPQEKRFSSLNLQFNQVNNFLMSRYGSEKENNPSMSSQSNLESNAAKKSTPSLQEYLVKNRPDFVDIAEARRKCLSDLALLRQFKKEKQKILWTLTEGLGNVEPSRPQKTRRMFTTKMMKDITKKRYKKLPEIQRRAYEQKVKQEALTNRIMAQIFNKKLQEKVHKGQITLAHTVSVVSM